jgi:hypothetical protein
MEPNGNTEGPISPAEKVRRVFGEVRAAEIAGLSLDGFRKWLRQRSTGGTGGLVPAIYQARYLRLAQQQGLDLTAEDLIAEPY